MRKHWFWNSCFLEMTARILAFIRSTLCTFRYLLYDLFYFQLCRLEFYFSPDNSLTNDFQFSATYITCFLCRNYIFLNLFWKTCQHFFTNTRFSCNTVMCFDGYFFLLIAKFNCKCLSSVKKRKLSICLLRAFCGWAKDFLTCMKQCLNHVFNLYILFFDSGILLLDFSVLFFNLKILFFNLRILCLDNPIFCCKFRRLFFNKCTQFQQFFMLCHWYISFVFLLV